MNQRPVTNHHRPADDPGQSCACGNLFGFGWYCQKFEVRFSLKCMLLLHPYGIRNITGDHIFYQCYVLTALVVETAKSR